MNEIKQPLSHCIQFNEIELAIFEYCLRNLKLFCFQNEAIYSEFSKKFEFFRKEENGVYQMFRNRNLKATYMYNYNLAKNLWEKKVEPKVLASQFTSAKEFRQSINELRKEYDMKAIKGTDEHVNAWSKWIESNLIGQVEKNIRTQKGQQYKIRELELQRKEVERKKNEEIMKNKKLIMENQKLKEENIRLQLQDQSSRMTFNTAHTETKSSIKATN